MTIRLNFGNFNFRFQNKVIIFHETKAQSILTELVFQGPPIGLKTTLQRRPVRVSCSSRLSRHPETETRPTKKNRNTISEIS